MKIQEMYREYKKLSKITEAIEENNPEDDEAWDKAYKAEFEAHMELVNELVKTLQISSATARKMIASEKFENIMNLAVEGE